MEEWMPWNVLPIPTSCKELCRWKNYLYRLFCEKLVIFFFVRNQLFNIGAFYYLRDPVSYFYFTDNISPLEKNQVGIGERLKKFQPTVAHYPLQSSLDHISSYEYYIILP